MTEHTHKPEQAREEVNIQIGDNGRGRAVHSHNILAVAILVGSLFIAGSVIYGAKAIQKNLGGASLTGSRGQAAVAGTQNGAPAGEGQAVQVTDRDDQPIIGNKDAKVTMYEFADFQCPFCARFFSETFNTIKTKYIDTGKVKLIFRHLPLADLHQNAQKASEAAECANRQGKFEQYYETLFSKGQGDGTGLAVADLKKYADDLGLNKGTLGFNKNQFNTCLDQGQAQEAIKQDAALAASLGITGTPTFVINGQKIIGAQPTSTFEQAIEDALKQ